MLNLGAEYVWLDVLCLRQKEGLREDLREEEWKVDVAHHRKCVQQGRKCGVLLERAGTAIMF